MDDYLAAPGFRHELLRRSPGIVERPVLRHRLVRSGDAHLPIAVSIPNHKSLLAHLIPQSPRYPSALTLTRKQGRLLVGTGITG